MTSNGGFGSRERKIFSSLDIQFIPPPQGAVKGGRVSHLCAEARKFKRHDGALRNRDEWKCLLGIRVDEARTHIHHISQCRFPPTSSTRRGEENLPTLCAEITLREKIFFLNECYSVL
ncbi:hypothetical protein I7I53_08488 [Histoplasma capsulatum var. duboisii H88]|uniref:Uncharacterized protein n=1 Tax=Ajellomyces capsulatus (strain H88) TaxID=544711 RepID=A0A8A1LLP8_AJEC8|nr:hypothetical protein I7I53_08488 [Histoplasma capsulatum var. duboisii H88]